MKTANITKAIGSLSPKHLLFIGLGLFLIYIVISNLIKTARGGNPKDDLIQASKILIQPSLLNYTTAQYQTYCTRLVVAMNDFGTDEDEIYEIFGKMLNDSDLHKLINVFGERRYWDDWFAWERNLSEWIYKELNEDEIKKLNSILTANGIIYQY